MRRFFNFNSNASARHSCTYELLACEVSTSRFHADGPFFVLIFCLFSTAPCSRATHIYLVRGLHYDVLPGASRFARTLNTPAHRPCSFWALSARTSTSKYISRVSEFLSEFILIFGNAFFHFSGMIRRPIN